MRLNNRGWWLAGAVALSGCSSGWWHDPPATPAAVPSPSAYDPSPVSYPQGGDPIPADAGANYAVPPAKLTPTPRAQPDSSYDEPPQLPPPRYDNVGYAVWSNAAGTVAAAHPSLPFGSFAEVTALDSGRTIVVPITATSRSRNEIELSGAAAAQLGLSGTRAAVRVRAVNANAGDIAAFKAGQPAPARPDTPPVLLNALRHKLSGLPAQPASVTKPPVRLPVTRPPVPAASATPYPTPAAKLAPRSTPGAKPKPAPTIAARPVVKPAPHPAERLPASGPGYYIQVAAVANATEAVAIARRVGGTVSLANGLNRVRFAPFDDLPTAQAARDDVAARGYGQARIVREK